MITFSTEFPLASGNNATDVLKLACEWLVGSPHTLLSSEEFETLPENESREMRAGDEAVTLGRVSGVDDEIAGLQYRKTEGDLEWTTSIVARRSKEECLFSIQVSCEALGTAGRLPAPKKPYFIRQALSLLGGGGDGEIPVSDKPLLLSDSEEDVAIAAALIRGEAQNRLPMIYVSVDFRDQLAIRPADLSKFMSGIAHVVVEPSRAFSSSLRPQVDGRNIYGGLIGVYWPQSNARRIYNLDRFDGDERALQRAIFEDVRLALANRRLTSDCTWSHLQERLSRQVVERLRNAGSTTIADYVAAFDADIKSKDRLLAEANAEIYRLNGELKRASDDATVGTGGLLQAGKEQDLWANEARELLLAVLRDSLRNLREGSRRLHVVKDVLEKNPQGTVASAMEADVKAALKTYVSMDAKTRGSLNALGFSISEDGKHYKLTFRGDPRYMFVLSKTSSDHRAGKNMASEITSTLF